MQLSQVDLNLFTVFATIYRERGITAASKRLHLSQPAVSHALARLRELLNDPLFERHGNEMIPTPRARELASTVDHSLSGLEKLLKGTTHFDPVTCQRVFRIEMREAHEAAFLPAIKVMLSNVAPRVGVFAVRLERRDLEEDLQSGEIDLAVDTSFSMSNELVRHRVHDEPMVVLARKDHPAVQGSLDLQTYLALEHVLVTGRRRGGGFEDVALERLHATRSIRVRCQLHAAASEIVSRSDLLATMPRNYAERVNRDIGNQILPFPCAIDSMQLFLYWHRNVDEDPAHRWFREFACEFI